MATITKVETLPKLEKMKRVAAYARVSTDKDTMLLSLSNQVSYYSDLIQSTEGWEFAGVYADEAKTGTKDTRQEFNRLVQDALGGKIDMIITKSISRFARNTATLLQTTRALKAVGVDVYFQSENLHSISSEGEMMLTLIASVAQEESRQVSENMKWRIKKDFQDGIIWGGKDCYGYRLVNKKFIVVPEQAEVVKMVFQWYTEGHGMLVIAKELNNMGITTLYGKKWSTSAISKMLSCINYTGDLILQSTYRENHLTKKKIRNHGELPRYYVENDHEPIISREMFDEVTSLRKERHEYYKAPAYCLKNYPFTGRMFCGKCGAKYKHRVVSGKPIWSCDTYNSFGKAECQSKQIPETALYKAINAELGYDDFNAADFKKRVASLTVHDGNVVTLHFRDGSEKDIVWKDRSRRESWTPEMKEQARQRALAQWGGRK